VRGSQQDVKDRFLLSTPPTFMIWAGQIPIVIFLALRELGFSIQKDRINVQIEGFEMDGQFLSLHIGE
jgi:hypothetical protein